MNYCVALMSGSLFFTLMLLSERLTLEGLPALESRIKNGEDVYLCPVIVDEQAQQQLEREIEDDVEQLKKQQPTLLKGPLKDRSLIINYEHIFKPSKKVTISGFHHDAGNALEKSGALKFEDKRGYGDGFYTVLVDGARKSFFPAEWSRELVVEKIIEAVNEFFASGRQPDEEDHEQMLIRGKIASGQEISIIFTKNGFLKTAYPSLGRLFKSPAVITSTSQKDKERLKKQMKGLIFSGDAQAVEAFIKKFTINVNDHLDRNTTPLMLASAQGQLAVVQKLIDLGADLDRQNPNGATALLFAASSGKIPVVNFLLKLGADQSLVTAKGKTFKSIFTHILIKELKKAIVKNKLERVREIMDTGAISIDGLLDEERTALMFASELGLLPIVEYLILAGAQPNIRNDAGKTALSFAQREGNQDTIALLRSVGAHLGRKSPQKPRRNPLGEKKLKSKENQPPIRG